MKEQIKHATRQLLQERELYSLTLKEISDKTDLSPEEIERVYPQLSDLYTAIFIDCRDDMRADFTWIEEIHAACELEEVLFQIFKSLILLQGTHPVSMGYFYYRELLPRLSRTEAVIIHNQQRYYRNFLNKVYLRAVERQEITKNIMKPLMDSYVAYTKGMLLFLKGFKGNMQDKGIYELWRHYSPIKRSINP